MAETITATEARVHLGALLRRVEAGTSPIVVARRGSPVAVIMSIASYERLRSGAGGDSREAGLVRAFRTGQQLKEERGGGNLAAPEDMLREDREARDP